MICYPEVLEVLENLGVLEVLENPGVLFQLAERW
jgi:hypothetical protein